MGAFLASGAERGAVGDLLFIGSAVFRAELGAAGIDGNRADGDLCARGLLGNPQWGRAGIFGEGISAESDCGLRGRSRAPRRERGHLMFCGGC